METAEFIETLAREGTLLAGAAERAGLDAPVPTCPQWRVRDLVRHTGAVHRWAASYVAERRMERRGIDGSGPQEAELVDWYRQTHLRLVDALTDAPADLACWYFLAAPSPLGFWARRQAHETTVHRVDAEAALGPAPSPVDPAFAADGIDELLTGFHARQRSQVRTDRPRTLRVRTEDVPDGDWLVSLSTEPPRTERGVPGPADCEISGPAPDLYLALWNRGPYDGLSVRGDGSLVELWQRTSAVV
jgi:uncharacterized protein (TIGR03083 family)